MVSPHRLVSGRAPQKLYTNALINFHLAPGTMSVGLIGNAVSSTIIVVWLNQYPKTTFLHNRFNSLTLFLVGFGSDFYGSIAIRQEKWAFVL